MGGCTSSVTESTVAEEKLKRLGSKGERKEGDTKQTQQLVEHLVDGGEEAGKRYQVFLSYRIAESKDFTLAVRDALESAGYTAFVGESMLKGGGDWAPEINRAVKECEMFVPIITPTYGNKEKSIWTYREFMTADNTKKKILPVFLSGTYPPCDDIFGQLTGGVLSY